MPDQTLGRKVFDPSGCISDDRKWRALDSIIVSMGNPGPGLPGDIVTNTAYITEITGDTWIVTPNPADPQNPTQVINLSSISVAAGYTTVQEEGVSVTQRTILNFIGPSVTAADDAGNTRTNVTIGGQELRFGILTADVPGCVVEYDGVDTLVTPGVTADCVYPLDFDLDDAEENTVLRGGDAAIHAANFIWEEIIKAGVTTNADKPVLVRGFIKSDFEYLDAIETAFVITGITYPVTIMAGANQGAVSGTGNFTADGLSLLWGRDPGVSSLTVANPNGFDGPDNGWNLIMQLTDGTWEVIDMECA